MKEFINKIFNKDCFDILNKIPNKSVDLLFADPPYNLQLDKKLTRPDQTAVNGVHDYWDKFDSYKQYDEFTYKWLKESKRILKENVTKKSRWQNRRIIKYNYNKRTNNT